MRRIRLTSLLATLLLSLAACGPVYAAGGMSDYLENKTLDHVFGKTAYTMPTVYVALCTGTQSDTACTEPSGGSYARVSTAGTDWSAASAGAITNANAVTFTTATGDWGTVVGWATYDAASSGNILFWAPLTVSKGVTTGDTASFGAVALDASVD